MPTIRSTARSYRTGNSGRRGIASGVAPSIILDLVWAFQQLAFAQLDQIDIAKEMDKKVWPAKTKRELAPILAKYL